MISHSVVQTDRPSRYAKQLVSHISRKCRTEEVEYGSRLHIAPDDRSGGIGEVLVVSVPEGEVLVLTAEAEDEEGLRLVEHVLGAHLVRFGVKDELVVDWQEGPWEQKEAPAN